MTSKIPSVSIVIVNFNGKYFLKECLQSLKQLNYPKECLEIIVVDNNSTDNSQEFVRTNFPQVKLIINKDNNYCKANNLGIEASSGEYIAFLNNDTIVDKDYLVELIKIIEDDESIGIVGSKLLFMDGKIQSAGHQEFPQFYWGDRGFQEEDRGQYDKVEEVPSLCGASILCRRKCLQEIGKFDEDFIIYLEDVDLCLRAQKKRWKVIFVPQSKVYHHYHGTFKKEDSLFFEERNRLLLIAKHWPYQLPFSLVGKGYFTDNLSLERKYKFLKILEEVIEKIIKEHGSDTLLNIFPQFLKELKKIWNLEKDSLIKRTAELNRENQSLLNHNRVLQDKITSLTHEIQNIKKYYQQKLQDISLQLSTRENENKTLQQQILDIHKYYQEQLQDISLRFQQELKDKDRIINTLYIEKQDAEKLLEEVKRQLDSILNSTGFKFLLKPLWNILWPIKCFFKRIWRGFFKVLNKLISFQRFLKSIKKKTYFKLSKDVKEFRKRYLSFIAHNETLPPLPQKAIVMVNSQCNLKCVFCDIPYRSYKKKEMSKEELFFVIDKLSKLGIQEIEFTGGEPLLCRHIWEAVRFSADCNIKVNIVTNGVLIKENIENFKNSPINTVSVSIDGKESTHNYLRGSRCYSQIIEGIRLLMNIGKKVSINFVVNRENVENLREVYFYFAKYNIPVSFFPVINFPQLYFGPSQEECFLKFIQELYRKGRITKEAYKYYLGVKDYFNSKIERVRCLGLVRYIGIDVEGNIYPCCVWDKDYNLGNIFTDDIEIEWFKDRFNKIRKQIFYQGCKNCYNPFLIEFSKTTGLEFLVSRNYSSEEGERLKFPKEVHIRLTKRCNLKCKMCDIWKSIHTKELSVEQWICIIDKLYQWLGKFRLEFAGGEILLYKDFLKIIRFCKSKGVYTSLTTNGTLIDEKMAIKIIEAGLDNINISLDTLRKSLYQYLRGENALDKVLDAFRLLRKYRKITPNICVACIIMEPNLEEIIRLVEFVKKGSADWISFQVIDNNFDKEYDPLWFRRSEFWVKDFSEVEKVINTLITMKKRGYPISNSIQQLLSFKEYFKDPLRFIKRWRCNSGRENIIIDTDGSVLLCWNMPAVGNILNSNPKHIWESDISTERREQIFRCQRTCRILNCNYL